MNPMNPMNPFGVSGTSKKNFLMSMGGILVFLGSSMFIGCIFGCFRLITINKLINISSLDEPNVHG